VGYPGNRDEYYPANTQGESKTMSVVMDLEA